MSVLDTLNDAAEKWFKESKLDICTSQAEASQKIVEWYKRTYTGKKVICESKGFTDEKSGTRMFIREVTRWYADEIKKNGWWNTFTLCKDKVKPGLWVCEITGYRLDKAYNLICEVQALRMIGDNPGLSDYDGWRSSAWWLILSHSGEFLSEYEFTDVEGRGYINFTELIRRHPELSAVSSRGIASKTVAMYVTGGIKIWEIQDCLSTPSDEEKIAKELVVKYYCDRGGLYHDIIGTARWPMLYEKISIILGEKKLTEGSSDMIKKVMDYLSRQERYCTELIESGKLQCEKGEGTIWLCDAIEAGLQYRKKLKDEEKAMKKAQKKAEKASKTN